MDYLKNYRARCKNQGRSRKERKKKKKKMATRSKPMLFFFPYTWRGYMDKTVRESKNTLE
jgi:hypothetical protein